MKDTSEEVPRRRNYFGKFRLLYKIIGLSMEENTSMTYKIYTFLVISCAMFLLACIRFLELVNHDKDIVLKLIIYPYGTITAFAKTVLLLWNRKRIVQLLEKLEKEPFLPTPSRGNVLEEEELMDKCMRIIKTQSMVCLGGLGLYATSISIFVVTQRVRNSDFNYWIDPMGPMTIFNTTYSPNYEMWMCYETLSYYFYATHFVAHDVFVAAVLVYITFQFKLVQNYIRRIVEISDKQMLKDGQSAPDLIPWNYFRESLEQGIKYHLAVIDVADKMEQLFNGFMLFIFLSAIGLITISVVQTTLISKLTTIIVCLNLLLSCYWGEQLSHESQKVGSAAFEANFVGADLGFQKSLVLIIRRSQNPSVLTAGTFSVVSLSAYTWVLQTAYSASAVLQQVKG